MGKRSFVTLLTLISSLTIYAWGNEGPSGAPGLPHRWAPALKQAVGTSYEQSGATSPVWFTLAEGIVTEVFYPTIDKTQVGDLQFIVTDGQGFFSEQKRDTVSKVSYRDEGMVVTVSGRDKSGKYSFEQEILTDTASPVLRIHTKMKWLRPGLRLFILFKPAIGNAGAQNMGSASAEGLFASRLGQSSVQAALATSANWRATSAGYVGFSDGWQDLSKNFRITQPWHDAGPGNIALTGELTTGPGTDFSYDLALGFGMSRSEALTYAKTTLRVPLSEARRTYESGWNYYLRKLVETEHGALRFLSESAFARRSAQIIKMHEDKRNRGALIASLSKPAIPDSDHAMDGTGGYHLIWPRDLYHAAMGLLSAGDRKTPVDVLRYFVKTQRSDGSWAQNYWIDGKPYWPGLQMDEVSFPILLAAHLDTRGILRLSTSELEMVRKASSFILLHGPTTPQDRWEEIGGYVPSTIAVEIAALRATSLLTSDPVPASVADQWQSLIERWTLVQDGPHGKNYYLRASPSGNPDTPEPIELANGAGKAYASEILDGGFLELVRMGVRSPRDSRILNTLRILETPGPQISEAMSYRRYNRDFYGPNRVGGFWAHLAGERGHFAVAAKDEHRAIAQLFVMERAASENGLLPEQTISPPDHGLRIGLGVACPLVWAHAEDLLLHRSIEEGSVFDTPRPRP